MRVSLRMANSLFRTATAMLVVLVSPAAGQPTGPFQVDSGGGAHANEVSAAGSAVTVDGQPQNHVVVAWNDFRSGTLWCDLGVTLTTNGFGSMTDLYNQVVPLASEIPGTTDTLEYDPMTAVDPVTGALYVGAVWSKKTPSGEDLSVTGLFVARKGATASAFGQAVNVIKNAAGEVLPANTTDKPWMAAGRRPQVGELLPQTRVYITYLQAGSNANISSGEKITWSDDHGQTWIFPRDLPVGSHDRTKGHMPRVGPNGQLYVSMYDDDTGEILVQRSFDGGETFAATPALVATLADPWVVGDSSSPALRLPGEPFRVPQWPCLAVNPVNGHVYCVFFDTTSHIGTEWNLDVYFSKSIDEGANWSTPTRVANVPAMSDQFFPWCEVDSTGRIRVVYYDTRNPMGQSDTNLVGYYETYLSTSVNDGVSWTHTRVTTSAWILPLPVPLPQGFADYIGMATAGSSAYPVFTLISGSTFYGNGDIYSRIY